MTSYSFKYLLIIWCNSKKNSHLIFPLLALGFIFFGENNKLIFFLFKFQYVICILSIACEFYSTKSQREYILKRINI